MLLQIANHRRWAIKLLMAKLEEVPEEVLTKNMESSFGSIYKTLFHIASADNTWWQRIQLQEHIAPLSTELENDFGKLKEVMLKMSDQWVDWISNSGEAKLQHVMEYRNSKKEAFKQPVYEILLHIFNHHTYHHGQIICMLRQQHVGKLPATDFIAFTRKTKK